jgi:hypothetical protein
MVGFLAYAGVKEGAMNTTRRIIVAAALGLLLLDLVVPPVIVYRPSRVSPGFFPPSHEGHVWRYGLGLETAVEWPRLTGELVVIGLVAGCLVLLAPSPRQSPADISVRVKKPLALNRAQGLVIVGGVFVCSLFGLAFLNGSSDNYWLLVFVLAVVAALTFAGLMLTGSPPEKARRPAELVLTVDERITSRGPL